MVAAVCSYLLPPHRLINKFYWRPQDRWDEFRTGIVSGRHYGTTRPVYVLTSDQTFSGAEEFAYDVQTQPRGEVVGDTTGAAPIVAECAGSPSTLGALERLLGAERDKERQTVLRQVIDEVRNTSGT
jgi:hypothetical protein